MPAENMVKDIGDMLVREGLITEAQYQNAIETRRETNKPLGRILVEMGLISESDKQSFLRRKTGAPTVDLETVEIEASTLNLLPREIATKYHVLPVKVDRDGLLLAMENPTDIPVIDQIEEIVSMKVRPAIASLQSIEDALERYDSEEDDIEFTDGNFPLYIRRPFWYKALSGLFLPLLMLLPLLILIVYYQYLDGADTIERILSKYDSVHIFLLTLLGWGLWSVVFFEIDGLLFKRSEASKLKKQSE